MPLDCRGAAVGAVLALVVQAYGPTPLGAVVRGSLQGTTHRVLELTVKAGTSLAATGIPAALGSLQPLHMSACPSALCASR
jgi:hypothetical protein